MNKNLLSILILPTAFLSTQANAVEYIENGVGVVEINGRVIASPKCELQAIAPIQLPNIQINDFTNTNLANIEEGQINIHFENCTNELENIKLRVQNQGKSTLENKVVGNNPSNVSIAILNTDKAILDLSQENPAAFKTNINQHNDSASYTFFANYKKPDQEEATAGQIKASLNFDVIYSDVADDKNS